MYKNEQYGNFEKIEEYVSTLKFDFFIFNFNYVQSLQNTNKYYKSYIEYLQKFVKFNSYNNNNNISKSEILKNFIDKDANINIIFNIFRIFLDENTIINFLIEYVSFIRNYDYKFFLIKINKLCNNYSLNLLSNNTLIIKKIVRKILYNNEFNDNIELVKPIFKKFFNNKNINSILKEYIEMSIKIVKNYGVYILKTEEINYNIDSLLIVLIENYLTNKEYFDLINKLINLLEDNYNNYTEKYLNLFFKRSILLSVNKKIVIDDIFLENLVLFIKHNIDYNFDNFDLILINKIIKNDNITSNYHIKYKFMYIFNIYLNIIRFNNYREKGIKTFINFKNLINHIIHNLVNCFNSIIDKIDIEEYSEIIHVLNIIFNVTIFCSHEYRFSFSKKLKNARFLFNFKKIIFNSLKILKYRYQYLFDNDEENDNELHFIAKNKINMLLLNGLKFINYIANIYCDILLSPELRDYSIDVISYILKITVKNKSKKRILEKCTIIKNILINIVIKDYNSIEYFYNNTEYNNSHLITFNNILVNNNYIKHSDLYYLKYLEENIIKKSPKRPNKNIDNLENEVNIEFRDPIMDIEINNPIMCPTNIIMESSVLYRILLEKEINPFTRSNLSIEYLEKYNSEPKIIEQINIFKEKKCNFE